MLSFMTIKYTKNGFNNIYKKLCFFKKKSISKKEKTTTSKIKYT